MKVLYLIQTHKNPEQIYRLVQTIKTSSPESHILVSHDFTSCKLDAVKLQSIPGVDVISKGSKGVRGDFSLVQAYLDAISWLLSNNIKFDWLTNLSGQDYPTQSLCLFESLLANTKFDGFLQHRDLLSKHSYYGIRESRARYFYQYWNSGIELTKWQRGLLKPLRVIVNNTQPFIKIDSSYQLSLGIRAFSHPFAQNFVCYGGSFFKTISKDCACYLYNFLKTRPDLVNYYKRTRNSDESLMQTILVNSGLFNFSSDYKFYIDWTGTQHGHPRILTSKDYPALIKDDIYFARKFDMTRDSEVLDMLDRKIEPPRTLREPREERGGRTG